MQVVLVMLSFVQLSKAKYMQGIFAFSSFALGVPGVPIPNPVEGAGATGASEASPRAFPPFLGAFSPVSGLFESFLDSPPFLGLSSFLGLPLDPFGFSGFGNVRMNLLILTTT